MLGLIIIYNIKSISLHLKAGKNCPKTFPHMVWGIGPVAKNDEVTIYKRAVLEFNGGDHLVVWVDLVANHFSIIFEFNILLFL